MIGRAALFALAAAALVPQLEPAKPAVAQASVGVDNFSFTTPVITVKPGTAVTWTNHDDIPHTVTADDGPPPSFRSHPLDTGDQFARVFDKPGTYHYFCSLHPKMRGTVIVR
jgi:plastocyanin